MKTEPPSSTGAFAPVVLLAVFAVLAWPFYSPYGGLARVLGCLPSLLIDLSISPITRRLVAAQPALFLEIRSTGAALLGVGVVLWPVWALAKERLTRRLIFGCTLFAVLNGGLGCLSVISPHV